jgi:DNA-binding transcriptional LysR family regulator
MIDLNQIRIFHAVCKARSFTRAAEAVHLTQPGVSKHIKQVEESFGVAMFDRLGKKVALTQAGEMLYEASEAIMQSAANAEQRIADLRGVRGGRLALGASFPIGIYALPRMLAAFRREHPAVELTLDISLSEKIAARVLANKLDLGLVSHDVSDARLAAREFMSDELVAIAPPGHRWAQRKGKTKSVAPQELAAETVILAARGAGTRAVLEERLAALKLVLPRVVEFGNTEGVKRAVEAGLGVSAQARSVVQREMDAGFLAGLRITGMETKIRYYCVQRREKHLCNAARAFLELLRA